MLIITGGNGHLGRATIEFLLQKGVNPADLRVSVRDKAKAAHWQNGGIDVRQADYDNRQAMKEAFRGGDTLLLISGDAPVDIRIAQHRRAVDAAIEAGISHIVYTSVSDAEASSPFTFAAIHADTEAYIKESGLAYTFFRNALYMEVLPMMLAPALQSGQLAMPTGTGKLVFTLREDIAEALANVLLQKGAHVNKTYLISSSQAYSIAEVAAIVSHITGQPITHVSIDRKLYRQGLLGAGFPPFMVDAFAGMTEAVERGRFGQTSDTLGKLLNRKPVDIKEYLNNALAVKVQ